MDLILLEDFLRMEIEELPFIVGGGLVLPGNVSYIIGPAKLGKSLFCLNIALSIVHGTPFLDIFPITSPYRVLYVQQEVAPFAVQQRLRNLTSVTGESEGMFGLITQFGIDLGRAEQWQELKEHIDAFEPRVIILDPLSLFHSMDENSARDMKQLFKLVRSLAGEERAMIVVHHTTKPPRDVNEINPMLEGGYAARGSATLFDYAAATMTLWPENTDERHRLIFSLRYHEPISQMIIEREKKTTYYTFQSQEGDIGQALTAIFSGVRRFGYVGDDYIKQVAETFKLPIEKVQRAAEWLENLKPEEKEDGQDSSTS